MPDDHPFTDASRGPRLQKVLAEAGIGSRRACEELIEAGEVAVNGTLVASLPAWVDPVRDHITVRGKRIRSPEKLVYVMLFKPRGVVCTNEEPPPAQAGRRRAIDMVNHPSKARLYPVGRLDVESSGLLMLTNDGEMANLLTHPRFGVHKTYEVTVAGQLDDDAIKRLERGIFLTDRRSRRRTKAASRTTRSSLKLLKRDRDRTLLLMDLREGRNRQIRRMMADVGHKVRKLRRVQMGPLKLSHVRPGEWRDLYPQELSALKRVAQAAEARLKRESSVPSSRARK